MSLRVSEDLSLLAAAICENRKLVESGAARAHFQIFGNGAGCTGCPIEVVLDCMCTGNIACATNQQASFI